ncbi:MAG: AEC family transporter [Clostridia bacterium]|nr:AEC family transporter [Clostridia bacterium]
MNDNIMVCVNGIVPIFFLIGLGIFLRHMHILNENFCERATALVFKLVLPTAIFNDIISSDISTNFEPRVLIVAMGITIVMFAAVWVMTVRVTKDGRKRAAFSQGAFRANYAILGLPLTKALFSSAAAENATVLLAASMVVMNVLGVVYLEMFMNKEGGIKSTLKGIATNPVIIAASLGIIFYLVSVPIPKVANRCLTYIGQMSTPLSLITIGASMRWANIHKTWKLSVLAAVNKTIFTPLVFVPIAYWLGIRGEGLGVIFVFLASPAAVAGYAMTRDRGGDYDLAGNIIVLSTAISFFVMLFGTLFIKLLI